MLLYEEFSVSQQIFEFFCYYRTSMMNEWIFVIWSNYLTASRIRSHGYDDMSEDVEELDEEN